MKKFSLYIMLVLVGVLVTSCGRTDDSCKDLEGIWLSPDTDILSGDTKVGHLFYLFAFDSNTKEFYELESQTIPYETAAFSDSCRIVSTYSGTFSFENNTIELTYSKDNFNVEVYFNEEDKSPDQIKENLRSGLISGKMVQFESTCESPNNLAIDSLEPKKSFILNKSLHLNYLGDMKDLKNSDFN